MAKNPIPPDQSVWGRFNELEERNREILRDILEKASAPDPKRGEVVVFKVPAVAKERCGAGGVFVKRIIGLPGELWEERHGYVYINGKKLNEPYIKADRRDTETIPSKTIAAGQYLMLGDNRASSCDSRRWGTVPRKNLIGPVFAVYWPPSRLGFK